MGRKGLVMRKRMMRKRIASDNMRMEEKINLLQGKVLLFSA